MKHEIIELYDMQIIGMSKKIAFNEAKEECPKFWGEFVEKIIKPVIFEKQEPNAFQKAAFDNGVGEFGLCTCDMNKILELAAKTPLLTSLAVFIKVAKCPQECNSSHFIAGSG